MPVRVFRPRAERRVSPRWRTRPEPARTCGVKHPFQVFETALTLEALALPDRNGTGCAVDSEDGFRGSIGHVVSRLLVGLCMYIGFAAVPAFACDIVAPNTANVGTYSPTAVPTGTNIATTGSFKCPNGSILSLLAADYLRATLTTTGTLTLAAATGGSVTYTLFATADATAPLTTNVRRSYMEGTTLSLLGSSKAEPPIYIRLAAGATPPAGIYKGKFQITWSWQFCNGVAVLGACLLGDLDKGDKSVSVDVAMTVAKNAVVTVTQRATWEASAATVNPKAIPGSKLRMMMLIENPNPFALDADTLAATLPTPTGLRIALDGDGTNTGPVVRGDDTTGATGLLFTYTSPSSTTDNVDFASGNGVWGYVPTAGDTGTQGNVTAVRFSPKGTMAANTAYTISIPYSVK